MDDDEAEADVAAGTEEAADADWRGGAATE
jgi:hypothetical protein